MPVTFFAGGQGHANWFDRIYENQAMLDVAEALYRAYQDDSENIVIVFNLQKPSPWADMLVFTERGAGVIDFKHYIGAVQGTLTSKWMYKETNIPVNSGSHMNPFAQVGSYRRKLAEYFARSNIDRWSKVNDIHACVLLTGPCPPPEVAIGPEQLKWFSFQRPSTITRWVRSLATTRSAPTNNLPTILKRLLDMQPFAGLERALQEVTPWGRLTPLMCQSQTQAVTHVLRHSEVRIGRDDEKCSIPLHGEHVSREHAVIHRGTGEGGKPVITIVDVSRNGTWVRGQRLKQDDPCELRVGDDIVFGGAPGSRVVEATSFRFVVSARRPDSTVYQQDFDDSSEVHG